tara:strand:+ start:795 stop:2387 length:1593 start_codon:yes stop_codon:yes gene_type:complete
MATPQISQYNFTVEQEQANHFLGPVRGALGGLPVAEQMQDYFLVYQQAGGTGPEIIDETAFFITYLVSSDGEISKPVDGYTSQDNLLQNFAIGSTVLVRNDASTALNSQLAGKHKITAVGRQSPILYTQQGFLTSSFSETIQFLGPQGTGVSSPGTAPYAQFTLLNPTEASEFTTQINSTPTPLTGYDAEGPIPDQTPHVIADVDDSAGTYTFTPSPGTLHDLGNLDSLTFQLEGVFHNYRDWPIGIKVAILADGVIVASKVYTAVGVGGDNIIPSIPGPNGSYNALNTGNDPLIFTFVQTGAVFSAPGVSNQITAGMVISAQVSTTLGYNGGGAVYMPSFTFRANSQNPSATPPVDGTQNVVSWSTGSGVQTTTFTWLTGSSFISNGYGLTQNSALITDDAVENFNLSPIETPFLPRVGDRIRFEYNKATDYFIYEVIPPNLDPQNRVKFRINAPVPSRVERGNFIIHRTNPADPAYIILDINKNNLVADTQNFNGLILPEYPTQKLKDNLDRITVDLKERGIITDNEA